MKFGAFTVGSVVPGGGATAGGGVVGAVVEGAVGLLNGKFGNTRPGLFCGSPMDCLINPRSGTATLNPFLLLATAHRRQPSSGPYFAVNTDRSGTGLKESYGISNNGQCYGTCAMPSKAWSGRLDIGEKEYLECHGSMGRNGILCPCRIWSVSKEITVTRTCSGNSIY